MTHLTEDQVDELLMGSLEPAEATQMREHAANCEICAANLAEFEVPIASFKAVSLSWSERRSATLPVRLSPRRAGVRWGLGFAWGTAATAVLLAAAIPLLRHEQSVQGQQAFRNAKIQGARQSGSTFVPPATVAPAIVAPLNSAIATNDNAVVQENAQKIASDNRMLAMVDEELNTPIPSLRAASRDRDNTRPNPQTTVQD